MPADSAIALLTRWAKPMPDLGPAVYRVTTPPGEHKHAYHVYCPWSLDDQQLLFLRYNRTHPEGEVCVMDARSGNTRVVGRTRKWNCHNAARQQWQGDRDRIVYPFTDATNLDTAITMGTEGAENNGPTLVSVKPDGTDTRLITTGSITAPICGPDGQWVYGGTPLPILFPGDAIGPRHNQGVFRVNLDTGKRELVLSIEQALAVLPHAADVIGCHLWVKMFVVHPARNRLLFNLTNTFWDLDGREPRVREIISVGVDGSTPAYVGEICHHPNWHPIQDQVVANMRDADGVMRFTLYPGGGGGTVGVVPHARGSGHPTFSPDGRWLFTDAHGTDGNQVIVCDPRTGQTIKVLEYTTAGGGYVSFPAVKNRPAGETVMDTLAWLARNATATWQTQCHPAWSRDGSAVLINIDLGDGSQLYVIDVACALADAEE